MRHERPLMRPGRDDTGLMAGDGRLRKGEVPLHVGIGGQVVWFGVAAGFLTLGKECCGRSQLYALVSA